MAGSLETNKILAALLTAGIFASGAGVMSRIIYHPAAPDEPAYLIEVAGEDAAGAGDGGGEEISIAALLADADAAGGESGAKKCAACHTFEEGGANKIGPNLYGIVGRDIASVSGFAYSDALTGLEGEWSYDALNAFLVKPKDFAPGTKMAYAGMKNDEARGDLIAYLRSLAADPLPLPEAEAVETEAAGGTEGGESEGEAAAETPDGTAEETEASAETAADAAVETAADVAEGGEQMAGEMAEEAASLVESAEETTAGAAEVVQDAASETAEAAGDAVADSAEETAKVAEEAAAAAMTDAASDASTAAGAGASGLVALIADGDVAKGEKVSKKCKACHVFDEGGKNKLGPVLYDVVGRDIASYDGFNYSGALKGLDGDWTYDRLDQFLAAPKKWLPGTKMVFAGVKKEQDRADLLAYLRTLAAEPAPLAEGG